MTAYLRRFAALDCGLVMLSFAAALPVRAEEPAAALLGLGQTAQGAKLLLEGLAALQADVGALPLNVNNAARWAADYHLNRNGAT